MSSLDPGHKIESLFVSGPQSTARAFRSRKRRRCDEEFAHDRNIDPGDLYVRLVAFPGHDANPYGPRPSILKICERCADHYAGSDAAKALQLRKLRDHVAARDIDGLIKCLADGMTLPKVARS